ncbi:MULTISPECIES: halocyanin domain-containing protein [Halorussus]|uniref:halocyanin domain-containing protein n=1 Tax=Halorussus TaxID=1070314 RepID=UPI000E213FD5|nr:MULTISPECIES: halocyanin domain-containing protein [Halorussus]NHN61491.1 halocyanin domain-containing protein [Halorussus sp. JP-T4]
MNSDTSRSGGALDRRTFLKGAAGVAGAAAVGAGAATPAAAQSAFGGWFEGVSNYDGVVDETGESEVTVEVGAAGNNGNFAFGPAAVRVDPGTTVVWKWTGKGGSHNVVAEDGSFESQMTGSTDHTFEQKFSEKGVVKYACTPHKAMGMKGAVVVGTEAAAAAPTSSGSSSGESASSGSGDSGSGDVASGFGSWFDDVSNYEGVVDGTGRSEVTITVGAKGNNGNFAFGPAAVRVDPGTTVVWKWTGKGGSHNVVAEDGSFESESSGSAGHTFEQTFDEAGIRKYACTPHKAMGMKGAVVVGDEAASDEPTAGSLGGGGSGGSDLEDTLTVGLGGALVVGLLGLPVAEMRKRRRDSK